MQAINDFLVGILGPDGPLLAAAGLGVLLMLLALPALLKKREDPLEKLKRAAADPAAASNENEARKGKLRNDSSRVKLDKYANFLEPQDEEELSALRLKLMQAGYRQKSAVQVFYLAQLVLGLGGMALGGIYLLTMLIAGKPLSTTTMALAITLPGGAGYYLPKWWVERRRQSRQQDIEQGFPDSLDLLLVCVEAGQSLDQAILRVSDEMRAGFPVLAEEYEIVAQEMKAGKDKTSVLRDFADRSGITDVASFVTVLIQSTSFGTSIADALRVYSDEMRDKRVMRAEAKANVLPTKLTLGTMMFTVPPLLIILIGPSVYDIYVNLLGGGGGGGLFGGG
ncbi:MAG: type II secretion system F family protein [Alphaproteobacteria bacterium]|nr:MAG: type II secretion system F family protein [Alphaproteobacteria bacterium]